MPSAACDIERSAGVADVAGEPFDGDIVIAGSSGIIIRRFERFEEWIDHSCIGHVS